MNRHFKKLASVLAVFMIIMMLPIGADIAEGSQYFYFKTPAANKSFKAGSKVSVSFYAGVVNKETRMDAWGNPSEVIYHEMPARLKVFKGNEEIYSKDFTYTKPKTIETTYIPNASGTLKLVIYGRPVALNSTEMIQYDSRTIKVGKPKASKVKSIKPAVRIERTSKTSASITCTNSLGFGMKVYRATSKNGKYKLIVSTKKSTYKDKKLSSNKVYYYKVKLYAKSGSKKYSSKWSAKKKAGKFVGFEVMLSKTSKGVVIKWGKRQGTGYYLVDKSTSKNGEGEVIGCYGANEFKAVDTDVKKGKTYYYRVTAWKGNDEKPFAKTAVKSIKF